eukprot:3979065-Pyramimonas_sp.AAC.1
MKAMQKRRRTRAARRDRRPARPITTPAAPVPRTVEFGPRALQMPGADRNPRQQSMVHGKEQNCDPL